MPCFYKCAMFTFVVPGEGEDEPAEIQEQQRKKARSEGQRPLTRVGLCRLIMLCTQKQIHLNL